MTKKYNKLWISWNYENEFYNHIDEESLDLIETIDLVDLDPKRYVLDFGKHEGKNLFEIQNEDPNYIDWLKKEQSENSLLIHCANNL